jgi:hypothetical protein
MSILGFTLSIMSITRYKICWISEFVGGSTMGVSRIRVLMFGAYTFQCPKNLRVVDCGL